MDFVRSPAAEQSSVTSCYNREFMLQFLFAVLVAFRVFVRSRADIALEVLALRQQVAVLKRKRPRPPLNTGDRLFWMLFRRFWSRWADTLVIVKPETVIGWHRAGFRLYGVGGPDRLAVGPGLARNYGI